MVVVSGGAPTAPCSVTSTPALLAGCPASSCTFTVPANEPVAATGPFDFSLLLQPPSSVPVQRAKNQN